jgi:hypothetical protein
MPAFLIAFPKLQRPLFDASAIGRFWLDSGGPAIYGAGSFKAA